MKVEVVLNKPEVVQSNHASINLNFTEARNSYISEYHESNKPLDSHLTFAVPKPKVINKVLTFKGSVFSDNYFYANFNIKPEKRRKKTPKSITLIWDVSSSAINRNIDKEIDVLKGYLDWMGKG